MVVKVVGAVRSQQVWNESRVDVYQLRTSDVDHAHFVVVIVVIQIIIIIIVVIIIEAGSTDAGRVAAVSTVTYCRRRPGLVMI